MNRILALLFTLFSLNALATERVILNPESNGDLKIKANIGGTATDAIVVTGSTGAVTVGPPAFTGAGVTSNGGLRFTGGSTVISGTGTIAGNSAYGMYLRGIAAGSTAAFGFESGGAGGVLGTVTDAGLWTLGASGGTQKHVINGSVTVTKGVTETPQVISLTGQQDNLAATSSIISSNAAMTILTGVVMNGANTEGQHLVIYNQGGVTLTISMNNGASSAGNKFLSGTNRNVTVVNGGNASFTYVGGAWELTSADYFESLNQTVTPSLTGACTGCTINYDYVRTGRQFTINGLITIGTITSGTPSSLTFPLPVGTEARTCSSMSDIANDGGAYFIRTSVAAGGTTVNFVKFTAAGGGTTFVSGNSDGFAISCIIQ